MLRLFVIAMATLASFFVVHVLVSRLTGSADVAVWAASALGFIATPIVLLRLWPAPNPSAKCPEGKGLYPECMFIVKVSESELSVQRPDGNVQTVPLSQLREVAIVTNDSGPFGADVWWVLSTQAPGPDCTFPAGATGEKELLTYVQTLPGFDDRRFVEAMGSTSDARFVCWRVGP